MRVSFLLLMLAALSGCRSQDSAAIADNFSSSGGRVVDLAAAVPGEWDRVCVLGPYSDNAKSAQTLGFDWPSGTLTNVRHSDAVSVLVFVRGGATVKYVEHSRGSGDFSNLSGRCFARALARFVQVDRPAIGWSGLFPADEYGGNP